MKMGAGPSLPAPESPSGAGPFLGLSNWGTSLGCLLNHVRVFVPVIAPHRLFPKRTARRTSCKSDSLFGITYFGRRGARATGLPRATPLK